MSIELVSSLKAANAQWVIVAGIASGPGNAARLVDELQLTPQAQSEALLIRKFSREGKIIVLAAGSDPRGAMYALLDIADRVSWTQPGDRPFDCVQDADEKPFAPERALSVYTFNRAYWESRFYDQEYWARYLDVLAQNRFNSLVIVFGYENGGFLAPCYPYFFDVQGFPGVRMVGITPEQQQRNLAALNRLIEIGP